MDNRREFLKKSLMAGAGVIGSKLSFSDTVKTKNTLINCYYYAPHNHSMLSRHIKYDLEKMISLGADIVSFCVQEEQLYNWHSSRIENFITLAKQFGLKVHVVPNRWGGLLAGWLDGFSKWSIQNQDTWFKDENYRKFAYSNPSHPKVVEHFKRHLQILIQEYDVDGIIWDEPRPSSEKSIFVFLDEMSHFCKLLKPQITTSIFAEAGDLHLAEWFCSLKHMDYYGADGHLRSENHQMHRMKNTIFKTHSVFYPTLKKVGKNTFFLIEGQRHRDEDLADYLQNIEKAFTLPMDHLMFYYSAHEMSSENEKKFNEATWEMIAQIAKK